MATAFIGFGSNLGNRRDFIIRAEKLLEDSGLLSVAGRSSIDETDPVEVVAQPRFMNRVVSAATKLSPLELLDLLLETENTLGRVRSVPRGPRTIDCDLLLYDDIVMQSSRLVLPHPGIIRRVFLLKQILEIDPDATDPVSGRRYAEIAASVQG
ncbi:MAG TPA: 2-amino-4-hydroxy-6-hydroxymethyldihydropteridine diphosphokinase [Spirochaetota bacterium]|nr:2-amino-4-hydroxy-6-hydroxymethyldihydropteridine diphosphokinase [Spirochaetota bacterium]